MNLRERLLYDNFLESIDQIIAMRPDALVHAGDLFHQIKPKTRAYTTALEALHRLCEADIPLVVIAGNHSMAKTRYTSSPLEVLEYHSAEVYAAYRSRYRRVELDDTVFHLIPNMPQAGGYREAFDQIEVSSGPNVLVTHGLASSLKDRRLHTVAEYEIDGTILSDQFEYIALGHFHGQGQVADNAWYSGSLEYCTYGEINDTKGGLLVDIGRRSVERIDLPRTPMLGIGRVNCDGLSAKEVMQEILDAVASAGGIPERSMCQITLDGIRRETFRALDGTALLEIRNRVLDLRFRVIAADETMPVFREESLLGVDYIREFERFVAMQHLNQKQEEYVKAKGAEILETAIRRRKEVESAAP